MLNLICNTIFIWMFGVVLDLLLSLYLKNYLFNPFNSSHLMFFPVFYKIFAGLAYGWELPTIDGVKNFINDRRKFFKCTAATILVTAFCFVTVDDSDAMAKELYFVPFIYYVFVLCHQNRDRKKLILKETLSKLMSFKKRV